MKLKERVSNAWSALLGTGATQQLAAKPMLLGNVFYGLNLENFNSFIKEAYQLNADVYSITSFIASKVAEAPLVLIKKKDEKKYRQYKAYLKSGSPEDIYKAKSIKDSAFEEITDHELLTILNKSPNDSMTGSQMKYALTIMRLVTGNSYLYGVAPDSAPGKFKEFHVLPSQYTFPIAKNIMGGVTGYRLNFYPDGVIPRENVCHFKYFNPDFSFSNPFIVGQSPLMAAAMQIVSSNSGAEAQAKAFQNGGVVGVLYEDGENHTTDEQRAEIQQMINQRIKGSENYKSLIAANTKLGYLKVGDTPVDLAIIEAGLNNRRSLCNIYHVRSRLFNDQEGGTYNNMKEDRKAAVTDAYMPELTAIEEGLTQWLIEGWFGKNSGMSLAFDLSVYPELNDGLGEVIKMMETAWWISPNEKRIATDYETSTDPEMDKFYIPTNLVPIDKIDQSIANRNPFMPDKTPINTEKP